MSYCLYHWNESYAYKNIFKGKNRSSRNWSENWEMVSYLISNLQKFLIILLYFNSIHLHGKCNELTPLQLYIYLFILIKGFTNRKIFFIQLYIDQPQSQSGSSLNKKHKKEKTMDHPVWKYEKHQLSGPYPAIHPSFTGTAIPLLHIPE